METQKHKESTAPSFVPSNSHAASFTKLALASMAMYVLGNIPKAEAQVRPGCDLTIPSNVTQDECYCLTQAESSLPVKVGPYKQVYPLVANSTCSESADLYCVVVPPTWTRTDRQICQGDTLPPSPMPSPRPTPEPTQNMGSCELEGCNRVSGGVVCETKVIAWDSEKTCEQQGNEIFEYLIASRYIYDNSPKPSGSPSFSPSLNLRTPPPSHDTNPVDSAGDNEGALSALTRNLIIGAGVAGGLTIVGWGLKSAYDFYSAPYRGLQHAVPCAAPGSEVALTKL